MALGRLLSLVGSCEVLLSRNLHERNVEREKNKRGKSLVRGSLICQSLTLGKHETNGA